jgi:hypothetical protein
MIAMLVYINSSKEDKSTRIIVTVYYSVAMKSMMPMDMILWRTEIRRHIAGRKCDRQIVGETHHGRDLIREIRHGLNSPSDPHTRKDILGTLQKVGQWLL